LPINSWWTCKKPGASRTDPDSMQRRGFSSTLRKSNKIPRKKA